MNILSYPAALRGVMAFIISIVSFFSTLFGMPSYPHGKQLDLTDYELVWNDEFDGTALDSTKWTTNGSILDGTAYERKGGYWSTDMCTVEDGNLHIATKYYENGYKNGKAGWYTGEIDTRYKYEPIYGYFECRCILPKGSGLWSAFWLYSDNINNVDGTGIDGNEVDIFESAFYDDAKVRNSVQGAIHYDGYAENHKQKQIYHSYLVANNPYEEYNTYGLEWTEDKYIFYINGVEVATTTFGGISQSPERIMLSVEVGGENAQPGKSWVGSSIETNDFAPTDFIVDYVRVYQKR